jgi:hypothetical protein
MDFTFMVSCFLASPAKCFVCRPLWTDCPAIPFEFPKEIRLRFRNQAMWKTCVFWLAAMVMAAAGDLADHPHPRLWFPQGAEAAMRGKLAVDPLAARLQAAAMAEAGRVLTARTCRYEIPDGKRLLGESRRALHNIMHSAWAWRTGGGEKYRLRALAELEAACGLKDWHPSHFLDTAEMATAVATGYDWLYDGLTPGQRAMCERAIIDKALTPAKGVYAKGGWWTNGSNNWAQVCGAGIALAAAAIAGKDEGLAEDLFARGVRLVEGCGKFYQPDGMYPEGPGYWHYGTNYHVMLLAACDGLDRPTTGTAILRKAGDAIMHLTGPTRLAFDFADGHAGRETPSPAQCWLAGRFKDTTQAAYVRNLWVRALDEDHGKPKADRYFPLAVLWLPQAPAEGRVPPIAAAFHGEQAMAMFRTAWDADAAWLAIKGGTPAASHGHMDVGSFVYDAHGTRWIHDLGAENYNLPDYFGGKRWTYFRLQNRSHNTLEIDGKLQNARAKPCPLIDATLAGDPLAAAFDLTDAYAGAADKVVRRARFDARSGVVRIEDEITAPAGTVCWRAFTDAEAEVRDERVILRKNGREITLLRIGGTAIWSITDARPPTAAENPNKGFRAVVLTAERQARVSLVVEIRP